MSRTFLVDARLRDEINAIRDLLDRGERLIELR